jgi:hypothetical protein
MPWPGNAKSRISSWGFSDFGRILLADGKEYRYADCDWLYIQQIL